MCSFSHPNVLGMEGICFDPNTQSPYLILPFMRNGDLKSYLKKKRSITQHVDVSYPKVSRPYSGHILHKWSKFCH